MDSNDRLAAIGRALSCTVRLAVLQSLAEADASVGELTGRMGVTQPNMSNHLAVLRSAGLVTSHRFGRVVRYRLASPEVAGLVASLTLLANTDSGPHHDPPLSNEPYRQAADISVGSSSRGVGNR